MNSAREYSSALLRGGKFIPPRISPEQVILRSELIENDMTVSPSPRFIFLEAQAGQGKTTTAIQYLEQVGIPFFWYQLDESDQDPSLFLSSLYEGLRFTLPDFTAPLFQARIDGREVGTTDYSDVLTLLLNELEIHLAERSVVFVFDDLHLVADASGTLNIIDLLFEMATDCLSFILLSRIPINFSSRRLKFGGSTVYLCNSELAFTHAETATIYRKLCGTPHTTQDIDNLHMRTEGWPLGVILAARKEYRTMSSTDNSSLHTVSDINTFFQTEILDSLGKATIDTLLKISFFDEIVIPQVSKVFPLEEIQPMLIGFMNHNCFIGSLDNDCNIFRFHPLFRDFLREQAKLRLPHEELVSLLKRIADYFLITKHYVRAAEFFSSIDEYTEIERLLEEFGLELTVKNRITTVVNILRSIPAHELHESPWCLIFMGIVKLEMKESGSLEFFEQAADLFDLDKNKAGYLLACAHIVYFHTVVSGYLNKCLPHYYVAVKLFQELETVLCPYSRMLITRNLSYVAFYTLAEGRTARKYLDITKSIAKQKGLTNISVSATAVYAYTYTQSGYLHKASLEAEKGYLHVMNDDVGIVSKFNLFTLLCNLLDFKSDDLNYFHQRDILIDFLGWEYVKNTIAGPAVLLWDIRMALLQNRLTEAISQAESAAQSESIVDIPHFKSQFLESQAFALALSGDSSAKIVPLISEAQNLREKVGGYFFQIRQQILLGCTLVIIGHQQRGFDLITLGMQRAQQADMPLMLFGGHILTAYAKIFTDNAHESHHDIRSALELAKAQAYDCFHGYNPQILSVVLKEAHKANIQSSMTSALARKRLYSAFTVEGELIPLLRFNILGDFNVILDGKEIANNALFTKNQRKFLSIMLTRSNFQISRDHIADLLWPDIERDKGLTNLDTMLSRFRQILNKLIEPQSLKNYFEVRNGIIMFLNCSLDAVEFTRLFKNGMAHARRQEWWQAGNSFYPALKLWRGCISMNIFSDDVAYRYCSLVKNDMAHMAQIWGGQLLDIGRYGEAIEIVEKAWHYDPTHHGLVKQLNYLYLRNKDHVKAKIITQRYAAILQQEEHDQMHIKTLLKDLCESHK